MIPAPHNVVDVATLIRKAASAYRDKIAVTWEGGTLTYAQLQGRIDALATAFARRGVQAGDRVAFALANGPAFIECYLAAVALGAIAVPLNTRFTEREFAFVLGHAEPRVVVGDETTIARIAGLEGRWRANLFADGAPVAGVPAYQTLLAEGRDGPTPRPAIDLTTPAAIIYTSGTTGSPKGVMRSQLAAVMMIVLRMAHMAIDPDTVCLATTPMFHSGGHEFMLLQTLAAGGRIVSARAFDAESIVRLVDRERVTHTFFVPTMAVHLTEAMQRLGTAWPSLELWVSAAALLPDAVRDKIVSAVPGTELWNCYGLTEGGTLAYLRHGDIRRKAGACVGRPMTGMELRVVDPETGLDRPPNVVGEIICRSPESMSGYWRNPEKSAETIRNGWIFSGDLGYLDDEGLLVLAGRAKDMIITGGENVYAIDVESYLLGSGLVREIAVIGLEHPVWGEAVTAVVVPVTPGASDLDAALDRYARQGLARYKCPKRFVAVPELPKNSVGKVMKDVLKKNHATLYAGDSSPS